MDTNSIKTFTEGFEELKRKRQEQREGAWADIDRFICPQDAIKGNNTIFDSTATWCHGQLAAGLQMLLVNPSYPWFRLGVKRKGSGKEASPYSFGTRAYGIGSSGADAPVDDPALKLWRDRVEEKIYGVFADPSHNFYSQAHEFFLSLTGYGTGVFYVEEAPGLPGLMFFRHINLKECYIKENHLGLIDTVFRFFSLSASTAAQKWPQDAVFQKMVLENKGDEKVEILHVVRRIPDIQASGTRVSGTRVPGTRTKGSKHFPYESVYIDFGNTRLVEEGGYSYFPFLVARWMAPGTDGYGSAPGGRVMADIKLLNTLRQDNVKITKKALDPPLLVPENGYHLPLSITPGSINFYRNGIADPIRPVSPMENIQVSFEEMAQCREAIKQAFHIDIFHMGKESKEMTAAEVQSRTEEKMRPMGAIVGRIETEFLNPLILAVYGILLKYGEVEGVNGNQKDNPDIAIQYTSPLSTSQKSAAYNSTEAVLGFLQRSGIPNIYPEIYDCLNWERVLRTFVDLKGVPETVMNTEEEKNQARQKREAQIQEMQALQAMQAQGGGR